MQRVTDPGRVYKSVGGQEMYVRDADVATVGDSDDGLANETDATRQDVE